MYSKGKTMQLIGQQCYDRMATPATDAGLQEIYTAHRQKSLILTADTMIDAYIWGFINGQRAERQRRKAAKASKE